MNVFSTLQKYAGSWSVKSSRSFDSEEKSSVVSNVVMQSREYPDKLCVCFMLHGGFKTYVPLANDSSLKIGDSLDLEKAKWVTLEKDGEKDILRVREN